MDIGSKIKKSRTEANLTQAFSKLLLVLSYLIVWSIAIIFFWIFIAYERGDAMGYSLMFLWGILPVLTFTISFLISRNDYWERCKWLGAIAFGIMYMLAEYATFRMANNISFHKMNAPEISMMFIGAIISLIGMGIGHLIYRIRVKINGFYVKFNTK